MIKVFNAVMWTVFVVAIGIAQILMVYFYSIFDKSKIDILQGFYSEGFFLFFTISLISGIFYEFTFETTCRVNVIIKRLLLFLSAGIGVLAMITYAMNFSLRTSPGFDFNNYNLVQNILAGFSVIVSLIMKGIIYNSR